MSPLTTKEVGARRAQLVLVVGGDVGRSFVVAEDGLTIGRATHVGARIISDDISREHARVFRGGDGRYIIEDLGSRNGTRVNGVPFSGQRPLELGDHIQLGASVLLIFTRFDAVEEQLARMARLDSVLQLASGLAHGFGNVMAAISGNLAFVLSLARAQHVDREELLEALEDMQEASVQGAELTQQLSQLSRRQIQRIEQLDIAQIARAVLAMLQPSLGSNIETTIDVAPACQVAGDVTALTQLLTNLCVNAIEAMPSGGHLALQGRVVDLSQQSPLRSPLLRPGQYVVLSVRDTGVGIDEMARRRALEPFFTTKGGTGLGLAMAFNIAREHGGGLDIDSAPDRGCRVDVLLPLDSDEMRRGHTADAWRAAPVASVQSGTIFDDDLAPDEATASVNVGADEQRPGLADELSAARDAAMRALVGERLVLVAMDGRVMRGAVARMLELSGYLAQAVPLEQLAPAVRAQQPDVVLLQVSSRQTRSVDRFEQLQALGVRVVVVTALDDDQLARQLVARGARAWLCEPFVVDDVLRAVALALD